MSASLFAPASIGGAVARAGFGYQDAFVLCNFPLWLSQDSFSHVVSEKLGDVEVYYFAAKGSPYAVFYEAKNHTVTPKRLWEEVAQFERVDRGTSGRYARFVLVCPSLSPDISPLLNKLERLRGVGADPATPDVEREARQAVVDWVVAEGQSRELAEFIVDRVAIEPFAEEGAEQRFIGAFSDHLALDAKQSEIRVFRDRCRALVQASVNGRVSRRGIEGELIKTLSSSTAEWANRPVHLAITSAPVPMTALGLDVSAFAGPDRKHRTGAEWAELTSEFDRVAAFIKEATDRRRVTFDSKQRMTMAVLVGCTFGATPGFTLSFEHNGIRFCTADHAKAVGPFFNEAVERGESRDGDAVACVSFPTAIGGDFRSGAEGLDELPRVELTSAKAITNVADLNLAVDEAKRRLVTFRSQHQIGRLHLFIKAPSSFAVTLGHRLNGVASFQLYDWIDGRYVPTASLSFK